MKYWKCDFEEIKNQQFFETKNDDDFLEIKKSKKNYKGQEKIILRIKGKTENISREIFL